MKKSAFYLFLSVFSCQLRAAASSNILVDQLGWLTASTKVAVLAAPQVGTGSPSAFTPGATFEIRRVSDNSTAFSGATSVFGGGATHAQSGDKGWWADFSGLTVPASYYLYLPAGSNPGSISYNFDLGQDIYNSMLQASVKSYLYQRCGTAISAANGGTWNHTACHVKAGQDLAAHLYDGADMGGATARNVSGGWHDAGDYRKYVSFTEEPLWDLMHAAEWYPCAFGDATNIPESGNGVPDILDEVKVELDWLLKMQKADGSLYSGVFVITGDDGVNNPASSVVTRYYANTSTGATGTGAFAFALGARLLGAYPVYAAYAATLQAAALNAWAYLTANPGNLTYNATNFQNADANVASSADKALRLAAAAELFHLTGGATYKTYFDANYNSASLTNNGHNPILSNYFETGASQMCQRALVSYALAPGATAAVVTAIKTSCANGANNGPVTNYLTDLYRAFMWDGHYTWGSNQLKAIWGSLPLYAIKIGANPASNATWNRVSQEYLHYFFGRNPLGWSYLTQSQLFGADKPITQFFHSWFYDGGPYDTNPAPGFLSGGPNKTYAGNQPNISTQPQQKAYRDWNGGWPEDSWEVTENGIYYEAKFIFLLAAFSSCIVPTPTPTVSPVFSPTPTVTPSNTQSITPTGTGTRTVTPTATRTDSPSPTWTISPTGTPSPSATATSTASPTPSISVSPTETGSPSATPSVSATCTVTDIFSATPTSSVTATATATPSSTQTMTPSPSSTATLTHSSSPSPTESSSPSPSSTASPSPSLVPTSSSSPSPSPVMVAPATATPRPGSGPPRIDASAASPNPNPGVIMVKLAGDVQDIELKVYSPAMAVESVSSSGPLPMGWRGIPLDPAFLANAANGIYHYRLIPKNGLVQREAARGKFVILK